MWGLGLRVSGLGVLREFRRLVWDSIRAFIRVVQSYEALGAYSPRALGLGSMY